MSFNNFKNLITSGDNDKFINQAKTAASTILIERDTEFGCSLLDWAAIYNRSEIVTFLSEQYPILTTSPSRKRSVIHYAARHGSLESLQILINHPINLEHKDQDDKTAIELAIQYQHANCARLLLNNGAKLPSNIEKLVTLVRLVSPFEFILYCETEGIYQLLSEEEVKLINATDKLSNLTLHQKSQYTRKPYYIKIDSQKIEGILLRLVDKYLYFCNRIYKENREEKHGNSNAEIKRRTQLSGKVCLKLSDL